MSRHPSLVYVSISGFGRSGELASMPAYDHVVQAFSGMASLQAPRNGDPALVRHGIVDKSTGLVAAEGILAAIISRNRTGIGSHVEISMLDVALSLMWPDGMMNYTCLDEDTDHVPSIANSFRLTPTNDGWVALVTVTEQQWRGLLNATGLAHYLDDPEYSTSAARLRNGGKVMREIGSILSAMESDTVVSLFRENDVPCMPVLMLDQIAERIDDVCPGMIETSQHPILGAIQQPRPPVSFDGRHGRTASSPALGADTDAVLVEAGVQPEEIVEMRLAGLVR